MVSWFGPGFAVVLLCAGSVACASARSRAQPAAEGAFVRSGAQSKAEVSGQQPMLARAPVMADGAAMVEASPPAAPASASGGGGTERAAEMLIVTGTVTVVAEDVSRTVARVREHLRSLGGTVVREHIAGAAGNRPYGSMTLRLPPKALEAFVAWLAGQARIEERQLQSEDVSRAYFEQELALKNMELTARRLQTLMDTQAGNLGDVLAVERELTRVRGEIEQLKGSQRYLRDRAAQATIELQLRSPEHVAIIKQEPDMKFLLVPSLDVLSFVDRGDEHRTRWGGGVSLLFDRSFALDIKLFPSRGNDSRSVLATVSSAAYSDFLGGGRRRYFNPYLGVALGGGRVNDRTTFAAGGEAGLELLRLRRLLIDAKARAFWFAAEGPDRLVISGSVGIGVPF